MAKIIDHLKYIKKNPWNLYTMLLNKFSPIFSDEQYIRRIFRYGCGYNPNLDNPQTFNEKLAWLKLHHHKPILTRMADKYEVKEYVSRLIGNEYIVPNYGVWNHFDEIDFESLPNEFVLKATHDSGGATICRDKSSFDFSKAKARLEHQLSRNFYWAGREWPYKDIKPRIIADKFLDDHTGTELTDYKFWCFNGVPKFVYMTIKAREIYENFYDMDFSPVDINHGSKRHSPEFERPAAFDKMKELAALLSEGMPFVRVDFFYVEGHIYFGEFTFFDWGGSRAFGSYEQDLELGKLIDLTII